MITDRLNRFTEEIRTLECDAALITRPENIRYLTGFTGEGSVLVTGNGPVIITDSRYTELCARVCPNMRMEMTKIGRRENDILLEITDEMGIRTMAVETDMLTYDDYTGIAKKLPFVRLVSLSGIPEKMRMVKDSEEIDSICRACELSSMALENILPKLHAGMTEREVRILLDFEMLSLGGEGNAFDTIAAAGINGALPHAVPSDYVIQDGDLLTLDFGTKVNGYCADMTRTIGFGNVSSELVELYEAVLEAHMKALEAVKAGMKCGDIDRIARDLLDARYPGAFGHSLGHGVGLFIHEQPRLGSGSETVLENGHVVTIEPGVYIPGLGGCRIEDTVIVTAEGYIDPVTFPKHLIRL